MAGRQVFVLSVELMVITGVVLPRLPLGSRGPLVQAPKGWKRDMSR